MSESNPPTPFAPTGSPAPTPRRSSDWGGKAMIVFALALLMAIPAIFVFALISERAGRADGVVKEISVRQGGAQQVLGPLLVAPYVNPKDANHPSGWYVVSPDSGQAKATLKAQTLHRGIFDVPVYDATVSINADFSAPPAIADLPAGSIVDWSQARIVMGFSDLRGAKLDVAGVFAGPAGPTTLAFTPASNVDLGGAAMPSGVRDASGSDSRFGMVSAPAGALFGAAGSPLHGGSFKTSLHFTGARRLSVMPFAKATVVTISGDWANPSFDGGFPPETRQIKDGAFTAMWSVPFIARGLSDDAPASALSLAALGGKDLGVTLAPGNDPYQNVIRALKYAVMFVGLVFLTFFVFEALSGRRVHPAQYVLVGLAQMIFYLLLLSLSEYIGFDLAFAAAAVATVGLIGFYAGWAFDSAAYRWRALAIFSVVYGLIYLLMRLEDFALLAGSIASFVGLSAAMYLTRDIDWYGGRAAPAGPSAPTASAG